MANFKIEIPSAAAMREELETKQFNELMDSIPTTSKQFSSELSKLGLYNEVIIKRKDVSKGSFAVFEKPNYSGSCAVATIDDWNCHILPELKAKGFIISPHMDERDHVWVPVKWHITLY